MTLTPNGLELHCNRALPNAGTIGYFLLIDNNLLANAVVTANDATNQITSASAHGLVTGARFRIATSGGTLPAPLSPSVDYYAAVVSPTLLLPCLTFADALSATAIDLTSQGSSLVINEQALLPTDAQAVILAHECVGNNYSRHAVTAIGASIIGPDGKSRKNPVVWSQQALGGSIIYRHVAFLDGGLPAVGNGTGVLTHLSTLASPVTIADTVSQPIAYQFGHEN